MAAINGRKAHNDNGWVKIGRVRMNSWISKKMPAADIYISERELVHIQNRHSDELDTLGISSLDYVFGIVNGCSEIRRDKKGEAFLFIVCPRDTETDTAQCAVVELTIGWINRKKVYKIKTARPMNMGRLLKLELIVANPAVCRRTSALPRHCAAVLQQRKRNAAGRRN